MKIVELKSENVKRLKAVTIKPDGSLVVIGGDNANGKTSVLDSIMCALGGKREICERPVRTGEKKATVRLDLGKYVVTRTMTAAGGGTLTVKGKDGGKYGQAKLNDLVGPLIDPLKFAGMERRTQLETLKALVGMDFAPADAERKRLYDERTEANRERDRARAECDAVPYDPDLPTKEVSFSELAGEMEQKRKENVGIAELEHRRDGALARIEEIEREFEQLNAEVTSINTELLAHQAHNLDGLLAEIEGIEEANKAALGNAEARQHLAAAEAAGAESKRLTAEIEAIDYEKARTLAAAKFPVPGLSFGDDGVLFNGLPFDQASSAERLRVSVAMGLAMNPRLKVLLIRDGSLLDEDSLRMVAEMAEEAGGQVWLERVGKGDECQIIIEDGMIEERE